MQTFICKVMSLLFNMLARFVMDFPGSSTGKEFACSAENPSLIPGLRRSPGEGIDYPLQYSWASLVAQTVKNPPATWETWVRSVGWEDPWRREDPTPIFSPGKSLWQRSLAGYRPQVRKALNTTERVSTAQVCHRCPSKEQEPSNFRAAVSASIEFGALESKIRYCFHFIPFYLL